MATGISPVGTFGVPASVESEARHTLPHGIRSLSEIVASAEDPPPSVVERLVEAGGVSVLIARQKEGKSMLAMQLAIDVANGLPFLGGLSTRGTSVLILDYENRAHRVKQRAELLAKGRDISAVRVKTYERISQRDLGLNGDNLERLIRVTGDLRPALLIIDPLRLATENDLTDARAVVEMLTALSRLQQASPETGILILHHVKKAQTKNRDDRADLLRDDPRAWIDRVYGSQALNAHVETIIGLEQHDDGKYTLATVPRSYEPIVWELEKEIGGERFVLADTDDQLRTFTTAQRSYWNSLPDEFNWTEGTRLVPNSALDRIIRKATPLLLAKDPQARRYRKLRIVTQAFSPPESKAA